MHINRHTYEEFFLLYNDGELSMEERKAVEDFVRENPDLEPELVMLGEAVFAPDESIVFENKDDLYRHEKKVIALPWFRIAAAAVVLVTLSAAGWFYLSNNNELPKQVMASKELVRDEHTNSPSLQKVEPLVSTVSDEVDSPSAIIKKSPAENGASVILTINRNFQNKAQTKVNEAENAELLKPQETDHAINIEPSKPDNTPVVTIEDEKEIIDVAVAPRDVEKNAVASNAVVEYVEGEEQEMIYFANTSLPKKSKFRGVFRKATRFLDKVTSLQ